MASAKFGKEISKNVIIGKARRMDLPSRELPSKFKPFLPIDQKFAMAAEGACCWPIGHPGDKDYHNCGTQALPGKPYCDAHDKVAYERKQKPQRPQREIIKTAEILAAK